MAPSRQGTHLPSTPGVLRPVSHQVGGCHFARTATTHAIEPRRSRGAVFATGYSIHLPMTVSSVCAALLNGTPIGPSDTYASLPKLCLVWSQVSLFETHSWEPTTILRSSEPWTVMVDIAGHPQTHRLVDLFNSLCPTRSGCVEDEAWKPTCSYGFSAQTSQMVASAMLAHCILLVTLKLGIVTDYFSFSVQSSGHQRTAKSALKMCQWCSRCCVSLILGCEP